MALIDASAERYVSVSIHGPFGLAGSSGSISQVCDSVRGDLTIVRNITVILSQNIMKFETTLDIKAFNTFESFDRRIGTERIQSRSRDYLLHFCPVQEGKVKGACNFVMCQE